MKKYVVGAVVAVALTGCSTTAEDPSVFAGSVSDPQL
ncbi:lipoprotein [Corynebacterium glutamicum]|nr:lipoprotein [Corynebacterium glutamicum]NII88498.1 hypothetical protein [Corynebacterium glutamicum]